MNKVLWESDNGKWKTGIIDWERNSTKRFAISDSIFIQYPTIYGGKVRYSNPTLLPKYVKEEARELLPKNKELLEV